MWPTESTKIWSTAKNFGKCLSFCLFVCVSVRLSVCLFVFSENSLKGKTTFFSTLRQRDNPSRATRRFFSHLHQRDNPSRVKRKSLRYLTSRFPVRVKWSRCRYCLNIIFFETFSVGYYWVHRKEFWKMFVLLSVCLCVCLFVCLCVQVPLKGKTTFFSRLRQRDNPSRGKRCVFPAHVFPQRVIWSCLRSSFLL